MSVELTAAIDDTVTGLWRVRTQTSVYVLDLDARTATRLPSEASGEAWEVARLRRDAEPTPLLLLGRCEVGERMRMLVDIVGDGKTATMRRTTPVVSIERVEAPE